MTEKQITLAEALSLVDFEFAEGVWRVKNVRGNVWGDVEGDVKGDVFGVWGNVHNIVYGTISGLKWKFDETPREKLERLIEEGADKAQLLEAINQLEDNQ